MTARGLAHQRGSRLRRCSRHPGRRRGDARPCAAAWRSSTCRRCARSRARCCRPAPVLAQRMQHAQAQRHLLEAALGDLAHEHRVRAAATRSRGRRCPSGSPPDRRGNPTDDANRPRHTERCAARAARRRPCQPGSSVRIATRGAGVHSPNDSASRAPSRAPPRNARCR